jgi:hypothetical protein
MVSLLMWLMLVNPFKQANQDHTHRNYQVLKWKQSSMQIQTFFLKTTHDLFKVFGMSECPS